MKKIIGFSLLLLTAIVQAENGCLKDYSATGNTRVSLNETCYFKPEIKDGQTPKIEITTSFDLSNYRILSQKATNFDPEGRPLFSGNDSEITPIDTHTFELTGTAGYYQVKLKANNSVVHWRQWIYLPYPKPANHRTLAEKYMPIIAFSDLPDEVYYPAKITNILNDPLKSSLTVTDGTGDIVQEIANIADFTGSYTVLGPSKVVNGQTIEEGAINFLSSKGHANFLIDNIQGSNQVLTGHKGDSNHPVVYYTAIEKGNFIYLTYSYIYAYDPKYATPYKESNNRLETVSLFSIFSPTNAKHPFDREGLIITLDKNTQEPLSVTYGGHLGNQSFPFFGCVNNDLSVCDTGNQVSSQKIMTIIDGKAKLNWQNVNKQGNHLIAYSAVGSHALYPAYGWYSVVTSASKYAELAGNQTGQHTKYPSDFIMIELDPSIDNEETKAFLFSGYWIDGLLSNNAKFPPFIRNPDTWAVAPSGGSPFDNCFAGLPDSNLFDCTRLKKYFPPNELIGVPILLGDANHDSIVNVLDILTIIDIIQNSSNGTNINADCNGDNVVNVVDILCVISIITSVSTQPTDDIEMPLL